MTHWGCRRFAGGASPSPSSPFRQRARPDRPQHRRPGRRLRQRASTWAFRCACSAPKAGAGGLRHAADGQRPVRLRHRPDRAGPAGQCPAWAPPCSVGQALMRNPLLAAPVAGLAWPPPASRCPKGWTARDAAGRLGQPLCAGGHRPVPAQTETASPAPECAAGAGQAVAAAGRHGGPGPGVRHAAAGAWTAVLMSALPIGTGLHAGAHSTRHPRFDPGLGAHHQPAGGLDQRPSHQLTSQLKALPCCLPPRSSS